MREQSLALAIEQIKERCNFSQIVGRHSKLVKTAQGFKCCCPLPGHSEKTPSFNLDTRKNLFYCYGCSRGGDVFKFLELVEGVPFMDAVRDLAEELQIELPKQGKRDAAQGKQERDARDSGYEMLDRGAQFFHKILLSESTPGAAKGLEYLRSRGISDEEIQELLLGWAPEEGTALARRLKSGDERRLAEACGLVRDYSGRAVDFFRGRLMIPILDHRSRVIAFSGRTLEAVSPENPKYKNSSETDWFKKKQVLYGLDRAQKLIREHDYVCLVEGYFDQWAFQRHGVPSVAVMGTALSDDHMRLLGRHTKQVVLVFDSDEAGVRSTKRYLEPLLQQGWDVKIFQDMAGKDPDEWLAARARDSTQQMDLNRLLKMAPEALEWWSRRLLTEARRDGLNTLQTLRALLPVWALAKNPLHKNVLADEVARQLGLGAQDVRRDLDAAALQAPPAPRTQAREAAPVAFEPRAVPTPVRARPLPVFDRVAEELLMWWLRHLSVLSPTSHETWEEREALFRGTFAEKFVLEMAAEWARQGGSLPAGWLEAQTQSEQWPPELRAALFKGLVSTDGAPTGANDKVLISFKEMSGKLEKERVFRELQQLQGELRKVAGDPARAEQILQQVNELKFRLETGR